ncbi:MAG TPA: murein biosynthesis integral membrane protein MurJ [Terriglobia bacterium]|nr:murein biosynthesis integral membrane protein MurJ [Terriglobia bacterium]
MSHVNRRIALSAAIVMASVLASRMLGFLRDWTVAHQIGSNAVTDTYYAAFTLPDFLNYLVAGGAISLTFIPVFAKYAAENREEEGWHVFSTVITVMGVVLAALIVVGEIYAGRLVEVIAPGFPPAEKARGVFLTRLMLPAQIFFYLGSIMSAVQYAKARFLIPSLAPVVYNLGIILGGLLLSSRMGITGFAVGVLGGAFAGNFLLQVYGAYGVGARFRINTDVAHAGFRMFIKLTVPIMLAQSLIYTDDWIIRWFGSYLPSASISWLSYAKTLMRVPLGVVGQAVGVASFPFLAQLYSENKFDQLNHALNTTLKGVLLLLVPISALTIAESRPLVYFIYSHTRMRPPDLDATAASLVFFSIAMAAWGLQGILSRGFYAARDTMTPAVTGTILTVVALPLYWFLVHHMQHLGLALASSSGVIAYTLVLFVLLDRRLHNREAGGLVLFTLKITIASVLAAAAAYEIVDLLEERIAWQTTHGALVVLVIASTVGFVLTFVLAKLLRVREVDTYWKKLRL